MNLLIYWKCGANYSYHLPQPLRMHWPIGVSEKDTPYTGYVHSQTLANASKTYIVILVL